MRDRITLREWQNNFKNGCYDYNNLETMMRAGWYDWYDKETNLYNRLKKMGPIICKIKDGGKVNLDRTYVFFKNYCTVLGNLYDQFKICDNETKAVIYCIDIGSPWENKKYAVYGIGRWDKPIIEFDTSKELVGWLNSNA